AGQRAGAGNPGRRRVALQPRRWGAVPGSVVRPFQSRDSRSAMTMRSASFMHSVRAGLALLMLGASAVTAAAAVKPGKPTKPHALNLFASAGYLFEVNRQQCGLLNTGVICAAFQGSPVGGGGY